MVEICLHEPLAAADLLAALGAPAPRCTAGQIAGAALVGGDGIVPGLAPRAGGQVAVTLAEVTPAQRDLIDLLARVLDLVPTRWPVTGPSGPCAATLLVPAAPDPAPWRDAGHLGWGAILARALEEIRDDARHRDIEDIRGRLRVILSRAAARATAETAAPKPTGSGLTLRDVTIHERRRPYSNFFAVEEIVFSHPRFDGTLHPPVLRAVFMAADAVTVLPYDPVRDRVLLVEQVRAAPIARGDAHAWILEPIAGRIEPGHTPEETAHKEAQEEAGLTLKELHLIGDYYSSTGCFSEYLYSFVALADLPDSAAGLGGVLADGEDIRAHLLSRADLLRRVDGNQIPDGPLVLSAYWLDRHLDRLRGRG